MSEMRQKIQFRLAFGEGARGEAPQAPGSGSETLTAKRMDERSANNDEQLMEAVCERGNCLQALKRVKSNKGGPGIDGMTVDELLGYLMEHWPAKNGLVGSVEEGTPQGGPLSPLLSNLVLDELDRELERRGHCFCRYADDCNIYVRSQRAGERVKQSITCFIERRLRLKVNEAKSTVARPAERKFLGFSVTRGREIKRSIAPKSLARFKQKVRELTGRTRGISIEQMTKELSIYLRGWKGYFGFCQTPTVLEELDQWIRRRLRSLIWKHGTRGSQRYRLLRQRGVRHELAAKAAGSSHGPWRMAKSQALHVAYPISYFDLLGLPRLYVGK